MWFIWTLLMAHPVLCTVPSIISATNFDIYNHINNPASDANIHMSNANEIQRPLMDDIFLYNNQPILPHILIGLKDNKSIDINDFSNSQSDVKWQSVYDATFRRSVSMLYDKNTMELIQNRGISYYPLGKYNDLGFICMEFQMPNGNIGRTIIVFKRSVKENNKIRNQFTDQITTVATIHIAPVSTEHKKDICARPDRLYIDEKSGIMSIERALSLHTFAATNISSNNDDLINQYTHDPIILYKYKINLEQLTKQSIDSDTTQPTIILNTPDSIDVLNVYDDRDESIISAPYIATFRTNVQNEYSNIQGRSLIYSSSAQYNKVSNQTNKPLHEQIITNLMYKRFVIIEDNIQNQKHNSAISSEQSQ